MSLGMRLQDTADGAEGLRRQPESHANAQKKAGAHCDDLHIRATFMRLQRMADSQRGPFAGSGLAMLRKRFGLRS